MQPVLVQLPLSGSTGENWASCSRTLNHHQVLRRRRQTPLRLPSNIRDSGDDKAHRLCPGRSSDNRTLRNWAARKTSKSDVMRACGRWPFPFLRNGDYLTPAFTDSPPCAPLRSPARALARFASLTPPLGTSASRFPNRVTLKAGKNSEHRTSA